MALPLTVALTAIDRLSNPLGRISGKLGKFGANATKIGKSMTVGLTLPILAAGAAIISTGAGFESEMNNVQALTSATGEGLNKLKEQAKEMGSQTQFSARQAAEGQSILAKAGFKSGEIFGALPGTLQLAAAANIEIGESADISATALRGYRLEVGDLGKVTDVLTVATISANQDITDMGEALRKAGPLARAMKLPFEETVATLSQFAQAGFKGQEGGTALRGGLVRLLNPTAEVVAGLKRMKIERKDLFNENGDLISLENLFSKIQESGADAGDVMAVFGQKAGPGFLGAIGLGSDALGELNDKLKNSTGEAARIAEIRMQGAAGSMFKLKASAEGLAIAVGESGLLDLFTKIVTKLAGFVSKLSAAEPRTLKIAAGLLGIAAAVGPVLIGFGALISAATGMVSVVGFLGPTLVSLATTLFTVVIPAIVSFTVALATNPVFLLITAIVALGLALVWLVNHWDEVTLAWQVGWTLMQFQANKVIRALKSEVRDLLNLFPDWFVNLVKFSNPAALVTVGAAQAFVESDLGDENGGIVGDAFAAQSKLKIIFDNFPKEAKVQSDELGEGVELETGLAMAGA